MGSFVSTAAMIPEFESWSISDTSASISPRPLPSVVAELCHVNLADLISGSPRVVKVAGWTCMYEGYSHVSNFCKML